MMFPFHTEYLDDYEGHFLLYYQRFCYCLHVQSGLLTSLADRLTNAVANKIYTSLS